MSAGDELSSFEQGILHNVQAHGCQVNSIFDPEGELPEFSYSIGFPETVGQPEVIVFGLDLKLMHFMVNETLQRCREGLVLADGVSITGLLEGFDCVARQVLPENVTPDYFNSALWYHRHQTGRDLDGAVQIVWPGAEDGLFPWQPDADPSTREFQPALYDRKLNA